MTSAEWFVVQLLTAIFAGIFAVIGACLLFFETVADNAATHKLKLRIGATLQTISASPLADLPGYLLGLSAVLQRGRDRIISWIVIDKMGSRIAGTFAALTAVGVVAVRYGFTPLYVFALVHFASEFALKHKFPLPAKHLAKIIGEINVLALAGAALLLFIEYTISLSVSHKFYSLLIAIGISPCALVIADTLNNFGNPADDAPAAVGNVLYVTAAGIGLSIIATIVALIFGAVAAPETPPVALSLQAIVANLVCDTLTLLLIFKLLVARDNAVVARSIAVTALLSLFISALLACCSLYFSFVGTDAALRPGEVLHVLIGLSLRGDRLQLSSFFFLMHTTFIPAALFLLLLLIAAGVKLVVRITMLALGLSNREQVNPFRAFAAIFGIFVAIFSAVSGIAGILKEEAEAHGRAPAPSEVTARNGAESIRREAAVAAPAAVRHRSNPSSVEDMRRS